jgi:hypothetical protein
MQALFPAKEHIIGTGSTSSTAAFILNIEGLPCRDRQHSCLNIQLLEYFKAIKQA